MRRWSGDRGSSDALGLALVAPAAIGLALVLLYLGRGVDSRATAQSAAEAAAQAAAQERSVGAAVAAAHAVGDAMLVDEHTCSPHRLAVDVSAFAPGGYVRVDVWCGVSTAGLEAIAPPALDTGSATAWAFVDPLRGIDP